MWRLDPDVRRFDQYDQFLRDDSVFTVAQTGSYKGAAAIEEYVRFVYPEYSPYFQSEGELVQKQSFQRYDKDTGQCIFLILAKRETVVEPSSGKAATFSTAAAAKFYLDFRERYVSRGDIFFNDPFFNMYFGDLLNTPQTREYVCGVMSNECSDILATDTASCLENMAALPALTDGGYIDNVSQGCRVLHAVFAETNPTGHCPHLAFPPGLVDPNGELKCQVSQQIRNSDLFSEGDMNKYRKFLIKNNIDPELGYTLLA